MTTKDISTDLMERGQAMLAEHRADPTSVSKDAMIEWMLAFYNQATDEQCAAFEQLVSDTVKAEVEKPKTITIEAETAAAADSLTQVSAEADRIYDALFNMDACIEIMALINKHRDDGSDGVSWDFALAELRCSAKNEFHKAMEIAGDLGRLFEFKLKVVGIASTLNEVTEPSEEVHHG